MGLDMYLSKEIYIGASFDHREVEGNIDISVRGEKLDIPFKKVSKIILEMGYWRKANQIHNWFVKTVQDGVDDCREAFVAVEQLDQLKKDCEDVLEKQKLAELVLPTESGFFFGSTEYDEYYFKELEYTIKIIDECLRDRDGYFYYSSSW